MGENRQNKKKFKCDIFSNFQTLWDLGLYVATKSFAALLGRQLLA